MRIRISPKDSVAVREFLLTVHGCRTCWRECSLNFITAFGVWKEGTDSYAHCIGRSSFVVVTPVRVIIVDISIQEIFGLICYF